MGKKPRTDTQARTDIPEWVQTPPLLQVNAKCDVVIKLSVFGTQTDRHTHTQGETYTSSHEMRPVNMLYMHSAAQRTVQCEILLLDVVHSYCNSLCHQSCTHWHNSEKLAIFTEYFLLKHKNGTDT